MRKIVLLLTLALLTGGTSACRLAKNLHTVHEGYFYRSAQLYKDEVQEVIDELEIKTIINLRGHHAGAKWYDDETAVAAANGVKHISLGMSASRLPHRDDLIALLDAYENETYPILVHCKAGADRAGEASALYQMIYMGLPKHRALDMLTKKYLHMREFTPAKTYFIQKVWLDDLWARMFYDPCKANYKHYDKEEYCGEGRQKPRPTERDPFSDS